MFPQRNGLQSLARTLCVLIFQLLLTHFCQGQPRLIGPPQPIIANIGHDIILPCNLEPGQDLVAVTLEWKRSDLKPIFVHARRARQNLLHVQHPAYKERTSIPIDELKRGNISLKLSDVKPSDQGRYECFIPSLNVNSFVELVVASGAVSSPTIELGGIDRNIGGVVLQCESKGWYPEPEVFWLDGKGNVLSAGPTETVRGPDDLYTVSSRVTVEKRHSNSFTCRVQQKNINQTRETHFYVPDDFFELQSSSSAVTAGLAVSLAVCITFIFSVIFLLWKWRQKIIKIKRNQGGKKKSSETVGDKEEAQSLKTCENGDMNKHVSWNPYKWFKDEHQEVKKLTEEKQTLNKELEDKRTELETKQTELQQLREEKKRNENELKKEVENKIKELTEEKQKHEKELEDLRTEVEKLTEEKKTKDDKLQQQQNELQTLKEKLDCKIKEVEKLTEEKKTNENKLEDLRTEVEKLTEEKKTNENKLQNVLQTLNKELEKNKEFEKNLSKVQQELQKEKAKIKEPAVFEVSDLQNTLEVSQAQGSTSSACQDSATVFIVDKVDPDGEYVQLRNTSHEDQQVGMGWELHVRVNNRKPIILTFENSLVFKAKDFTQISLGPKSWSTGDRLLINLYSDTGEMRLRQMLEIGHDPVTGHIIVDDVDPDGKYVRLKNKSDKEQQMKDWELHIQVDNRKPIIYTFDSKFKLNPGQTVTIWSKESSFTPNPHTDLVSSESWSSGNQLLVTLYSKTREQVSMKKVDNTNV